jgi:hypothetical protein
LDFFAAGDSMIPAREQIQLPFFLRGFIGAAGDKQRAVYLHVSGSKPMAVRGREFKMLHKLRMLVRGFALCFIAGALPVVSSGETVINLSQGGNPAIAIQYDGTTLSTVGSQSTPVDYLGLMGGEVDIPAGATFSLTGLQKSGPAVVISSLAVQQFTGGSFSLYHPDATLLLSGDLSPSGLAGVVGQSDGTLFTSGFGTITGGTLQSQFDLALDSLILQMHLANVNNGAGFSVDPPDEMFAELGAFTAVATIDLDARQIPEPASALLVAGAIALLGARRPKRPC